MESTLDLSSSDEFLCVQHEWKFTLDKEANSERIFVLSEFGGIPGLVSKAFRFGAEIDTNRKWILRLLCYINRAELGRFGLSTSAVTCIQQPDGASCSDQRELSLVNELDQTGVLFSNWDMLGQECSSEGPVCLKFRLYLSGSTEQYTLHRFDVHLGQQLWQAAVDKHLTDVILQVGADDDWPFSAHKFVLAARSPVFKAMFDTDMVESRTGLVRIIDVSPSVFQEFLRFLYTGQLSKPVSSSKQLEMVAEKYQVTTLIAICQAAVANEAALKDGLLNFVTANMTNIPVGQSRKPSRNAVGLSPDANLWSAEIFTVGNVSGKIGKGPQDLLKSGLVYKLDNSEHNNVTISSCSLNGLAWKISGVDMWSGQSGSIGRGTTMAPIVSPKRIDQQPLQVFMAKNNATMAEVADKRYSFRFFVHRSSTVKSFQYQLRDSLFAQQLWSSAVNKEGTDVAFNVRGKTFPAHRALLAARCPTLAALIPQSSSSSPGAPKVVPMSTMDPDVFEDLLYFLYTGMTKTTSFDQRLLEYAKTYQIETLVMVGQASGGWQEVDQEELSEVIMSLV